MQACNPRRGATLLVTVLIGLVAASITLVIVKTSLDNARSSAARRAYDVAFIAARTSAEDAARRLASDPVEILRVVGGDERPRICDAVTIDGSPTVVNAGQAWPADCGTSWTYQPSSASTSVWVHTPTASDPTLRVRSVVDVAGTKAGVEVVLEAGRQTTALLGESSLNLSQLRRGDGVLSVSGLVHSAGTMTVPATAITFADAVLATESSFSGTLDGTARWYASQATEGSPAVGDVRLVSDVPVTSGGLRAHHGELVSAACRITVMRNTAAGSNGLCLKAGASFLTNSGATVSAPSQIDSWLLLPERSAAGTVDVYYRGAATDEVLECPLGQSNCSLPALAASDADHPSQLSAWTSLGTFRLPAGALVATDTTTHLGLCGPAGVGLSASCTIYGNGSAPGVTVGSSFTLVVGTVAAPADLYLSGPLQQGAGRIGLAVSGDVLVPYWSHPVGGSLLVEADVAILGRTSEAPFRTIPEAVPTNGDNRGSTLQVSGSLAFAHGPVDLDGFLSVATTLRQPAAPWWASGAGWHKIALRRLSAVELSAPGTFAS